MKNLFYKTNGVIRPADISEVSISQIDKLTESKSITQGDGVYFYPKNDYEAEKLPLKIKAMEMAKEVSMAIIETIKYEEDEVHSFWFDRLSIDKIDSSSKKLSQPIPICDKDGLLKGWFWFKTATQEKSTKKVLKYKTDPNMVSMHVREYLVAEVYGNEKIMRSNLLALEKKGINLLNFIK